MRTLEEIRKADADCLTYSDGSLHCSEAGDDVAVDRRHLLKLIDALQKERDRWEELHDQHCDMSNCTGIHEGA